MFLDIPKTWSKNFLTLMVRYANSIFEVHEPNKYNNTPYILMYGS
jgi:hypothetical protein